MEDFTMQKSISNLFGIKAPAAAMIEVGEGDHPMIPQETPYVFREELIWDLLAWYVTGIGSLYLTGPTGSGKSSIITQVAARLRIPVFSVNGHSRLETPELIGRFVVRDGSMIWADGPLVMAMRIGGWFCLDEIDLLDPATTAGLNNVLEGKPLLIQETGEWVTPHPSFRFAATGNTNGGGDATGLYCGTLQQNIAARDRFAPVVFVDYPEEETEKSVLECAVPNLPDAIRQGMIKTAGDIRRAFVAGEVDVPLSTRVLVNWAQYALFFNGMAARGIDPVAYTFDRVCGNKASDDAKKVLHEILQRTFGGKA
jgi:cobaltochelatase CobS